MAQTNLVGKTILGYTVSEKLGSGAFGTVYKVIKKNEAGQYVRALKHITIPTEKQYNSVLNSMGGDISKADNYFAQMLQNIVSEIRILNDLSEKNVQHIIRYYENDILTSEDPKRYDIFILMEYLIPLEDYIQREDFCVRNVLKLGLDVLYALQECHANGIIHRDIKDDNIFVSGNDEYKIGDFGVSKVLKDSSKAESLKGTPNFLAPEVYLGKESYTRSVDLYSLGIVLYRLLNYNRNPFLPYFPEQYFAQDEDKAFEERMSGKTPDLPMLGGKAVGEVIVKAIAGKNERFQTADEFIEALKDAVSKTDESKLNESTKFTAAVSFYSPVESEEKQYRATIEEKAPKFISLENAGDEQKRTDAQNSSINRHLFESIGETPPMDIPEIEPVIQTGQKRCSEHKVDTDVHKAGRRVDPVAPPDISMVDDIPVIDKKTADKFVFIMPVVILLAGIIVFFIMTPIIYGRSVSFIEWLFSNPQNIMAAFLNDLRDPGIVLPKIYSVIGTKILGWIWLIGWITSLFFVGKRLQEKPKEAAANVILRKKEPYLMMQDICEALKQLKMRTESKQLDSLLYAAKKLEERLAIESDFGYGKKAEINCENNIARQLQFLADTIPNAENGDFEKNIKALHMAVSNINSLLRRRSDLKRR